MEVNGDTTTVGITQDYYDRLGLIWTFVPKAVKEIKLGKIFANVESAKCLVPFRSPVEGSIMCWNEKVLDTPDALTPDEFIFKVIQ